MVEAGLPTQEERPSPPLQLQERQGQRLDDYLRPRTVEAGAQLAAAAGVAGAPSGAVGGSGLGRQLVRQRNRATPPHVHPVDVRANGLASPIDLYTSALAQVLPPGLHGMEWGGMICVMEWDGIV